MLNRKIEAIFFDHVYTMHVIEKNEAFQRQAEQRLLELIRTGEVPETFFQKLDERYSACKKRAKETLLKASATEVWTHWMLPEYPANRIAPMTNQLTILWRDRKGHRVLRSNLKQIIAGVKPENCACIGDNSNRDNQSAQRAGFGATIILTEPDTLKKDPPQETTDRTWKFVKSATC